MQKVKQAFKRPPLKNILNGLLWTRFRFLHGVGQSIPQREALEAERFLLFPPTTTARTTGSKKGFPAMTSVQQCWPSFTYDDHVKQTTARKEGVPWQPFRKRSWPRST
ncbi:hypothetical protein FPS98_02040 [Brevibacillus brevis]|uniref:Uncharacterized protein n=1 Tax=Brevibacillus brevis TaxID=1393 RepID=A0A517I1T1_BREBE|nr:hypothetical protein FPS98_02040 [Brevibacillus brevis]